MRSLQICCFFLSKDPTDHYNKLKTYHHIALHVGNPSGASIRLWSSSLSFPGHSRDKRAVSVEDQILTRTNGNKPRIFKVHTWERFWLVRQRKGGWRRLGEVSKLAQAFYPRTTSADIGIQELLCAVTGLIWTTLSLNEHVVPEGGCAVWNL